MLSLLIRNIKILATAHHDQVIKGKDMANLPILENAYILVEDDLIADFGPMSDCPSRADQIIDATGCAVLPAWCDSHTHIVYAASREEEFRDRIKGLSYEEIAEKGGGILNSARKMQDADEDQLYADAWNRLSEMMSQGTGAVEIKSGYGLTFESEMKMLRVIQRLKSTAPIPVKATFLGAHAIPQIYKQNREGYIKLLTEKMIPYVADEGLADYCDVFCDKGFYTPEETSEILESAYKYGLKAKIHANELGYTGGVQVGVQHKAISVDHLEYTGEAEIAALLSGETLPTLLPSCAFFLGIPYSPARHIIDAGLPVVLATDYNPGSSPSGKMPFVISLACIKMKMLPEEAIQAATLNGAYALELSKYYGSIAVGKKANLIISTPISSLAFLPYAFGNNIVGQVILNGSLWQHSDNNFG